MPLSYQRFMNDFMYPQKMPPRFAQKPRRFQPFPAKFPPKPGAYPAQSVFFTNKNLTKAKNIKLRIASKGLRLTIIYAIIIQNNNPFGKKNRGKSVKKQFFRLFIGK